MNFCPNCGTKFSGGQKANFCFNCGTKLSASSAPEQQQQQSMPNIANLSGEKFDDKKGDDKKFDDKKQGDKKPEEKKPKLKILCQTDGNEYDVDHGSECLGYVWNRLSSKPPKQNGCLNCTKVTLP